LKKLKFFFNIAAMNRVGSLLHHSLSQCNLLLYLDSSQKPEEPRATQYIDEDDDDDDDIDFEESEETGETKEAKAPVDDPSERSSQTNLATPRVAPQSTLQAPSPLSLREAIAAHCGISISPAPECFESPLLEPAPQERWHDVVEELSTKLVWMTPPIDGLIKLSPPLRGLWQQEEGHPYFVGRSDIRYSEVQHLFFNPQFFGIEQALESSDAGVFCHAIFELLRDETVRLNTKYQGFSKCSTTIAEGFLSLSSKQDTIWQTVQASCRTHYDSLHRVLHGETGLYSDLRLIDTRIEQCQPIAYRLQRALRDISNVHHKSVMFPNLFEEQMNFSVDDATYALGDTIFISKASKGWSQQCALIRRYYESYAYYLERLRWFVHGFASKIEPLLACMRYTIQSPTIECWEQTILRHPWLTIHLSAVDTRHVEVVIEDWKKTGVRLDDAATEYLTKWKALLESEPKPRIHLKADERACFKSLQAEIRKPSISDVDMHTVG
jgi:hypothetical protein